MPSLCSPPSPAGWKGGFRDLEITILGFDKNQGKLMEDQGGSLDEGGSLCLHGGGGEGAND